MRFLTMPVSTTNENQTLGLQAALPAALDSVSTATINRYYNHIEAYAEGEKYGTQEFTEHVYKGHRQVVDKSKG